MDAIVLYNYWPGKNMSQNTVKTHRLSSCRPSVLFFNANDRPGHQGTYIEIRHDALGKGVLANTLKVTLPPQRPISILGITAGFLLLLLYDKHLIDELP
jgi:hypothetical protein